MTLEERSAILNYLEFNLTKMVEQYQITLCETHHTDHVQELMGTLYDGAYEVLAEMERTINEVNVLTKIL